MDFLDILPVLLIIGFLPGILINIWISNKFATCATEKGHYNSGAFLMCFLFGIVGYLYVIALPDRGQRKKTGEVPSSVSNPTTPCASSATGEKPTQSSPDRYRCQDIVVGPAMSGGRCLICYKHTTTLYQCKIKNFVGLRELPVCSECITQFQANMDE